MGKDKIREQISQAMEQFDLKTTVEMEKLEEAIGKLDSKKLNGTDKNPPGVRASRRFMRGNIKRFHGIRASLAYLPKRFKASKEMNKFGYMISAGTRAATKLSFSQANISLLNDLGNLMGNSDRENEIGDSIIPSGYTYFGQFVDHDITFDISSSLEKKNNARDIGNMRTPSLDLDSIYGEGPVLNPFLYEFPDGGMPTAIKLKLGQNRDEGPGGPGGAEGRTGLATQSDFDLPRIPGTETAVIGDPRNDENLFISQFHHAMLKFHNKVVDLLLMADFEGDIFEEAQKIVRHHYQWAVVHDFLRRICGDAAVDNALIKYKRRLKGKFRMPVEFSVGAYRFGHSMIRDNFWMNFNFPNKTLKDAFDFIRKPNLPVLSKWVIDFNAFFPTGVQVPVFNFARKIDSVLSTGLETLPGGSGIMAVLAARNLRRGLSLGLPSGQGAAEELDVPVLTVDEILGGLPVEEVLLLQSNRSLLLRKTPLWYYILREAAVKENGDRLGPLGAKIIAETFVKILRHDEDSYLNQAEGFSPFLPSRVEGQFNVEDIIIFSGVNQP